MSKGADSEIANSQPDSNADILPVVLSGGSGSRLWPESRRLRPKQFLPLVEDRSLMRATIDRVSPFCELHPPIVVTNRQHADTVQVIMTEAGHEDAHLLLEPVGRNTAPAVAVAAHKAVELGDPLMLVLPADHTIANEEAFRKAIYAAADSADDGYLVTFGVSPSRPETGYGYIKVGDPVTAEVSRVAEFREKPDESTASRYVESDDYLWNAGVFLFRASRYLEQLSEFAPDIAAASEAAYRKSRHEGNRHILDEEAFSSCRAESIDYAVMEKTDAAVVVPMDPGWNDVGSWASLWDIADKDEDRNVLIGDVITIGTTGSYVKAPHRLVATVGLDGIVVIDTKDAVLIARKDSVQDVRTVVDRLNEQKRPEAIDNQAAESVPGVAVVLDTGRHHTVRRVSIDAGHSAHFAANSSQHQMLHVVRGTVQVSSSDPTRLLVVGDSEPVPPNGSTELENRGTDAAEVVSVTFHSSGDDETTII